MSKKRSGGRAPLDRDPKRHQKAEGIPVLDFPDWSATEDDDAKDVTLVCADPCLEVTGLRGPEETVLFFRSPPSTGGTFSDIRGDYDLGFDAHREAWTLRSLLQSGGAALDEGRAAERASHGTLDRGGFRPGSAVPVPRSRRGAAPRGARPSRP